MANTGHTDACSRPPFAAWCAALLSFSPSQLPGTVLMRQCDLTSARARFQESLQVIKRVAAAHPTDTRLQRQVSTRLNMFGNVLMRQGDLAAARARFQEGLELIKRLAAADPSSALLQRDVSVSWEQVVGVLENMQQRGVLAPSDVRFLEEARRNAEAE